MKITLQSGTAYHIAIRDSLPHCNQGQPATLQSGIACHIAIRDSLRHCNQGQPTTLQSGTACHIAIRDSLRHCNQGQPATLQSGTACCHSFQNLLSCHFLPKSKNIKNSELQFLSAVLYGCQTRFLIETNIMEGVWERCFGQRQRKSEQNNENSKRKFVLCTDHQILPGDQIELHQISDSSNRLHNNCKCTPQTSSSTTGNILYIYIYIYIHIYIYTYTHTSLFLTVLNLTVNCIII